MPISGSFDLQGSPSPVAQYADKWMLYFFSCQTQFTSDITGPTPKVDRSGVDGMRGLFAGKLPFDDVWPSSLKGRQNSDGTCGSESKKSDIIPS